MGLVDFLRINCSILSARVRSPEEEEEKSSCFSSERFSRPYPTSVETGRINSDRFHADACPDHADRPQLCRDYWCDRISPSHRDGNIPEWNFLSRKYVNPSEECE